MPAIPRSPAKPADGPVVRLQALQRAAGNRAVRHFVRRSTDACAVQRDLVTSYEAAVGKERNSAKGEADAKRDYAEAKSKLEGDGTDVELALTGALATVLVGVLPSDMGSYNSATFPWQRKIDRLFDNVVAYANSNWDYSAGGAGRVPIFLTNVGNCGALATAFHQVVTVLATELNEPRLTCALSSHNDFLLTPMINGVMTGRNRPYGNVAGILNAVTGPFAANYQGVNRAHFNGHTWAVVALPSGGSRVYDLLMGTKGVPVAPSVPAGYQFPRAHDDQGTPLAGTPGFNAGKYMVAQAVFDQARALADAVQRLSDAGVGKEADVTQLALDIAADQQRYGLSRWAFPATDTITQCREATTIQGFPAGVVELAVRIGLVGPRKLRLIHAVQAMSTADLAEMTS